MGGLGHMGVKIAHAMGAEVTVLSQSLSKQEDGKRFGADHYYATTDTETFKELAGTFDLIINTVSATLPMGRFLSLLALDGTMVSVGAPSEPLEVPAFALIGARRSWAGSTIGGIAETQEMLDFCAEHGIGAEIELISATTGSRSTPPGTGSSTPTCATASSSTPRRSPDPADRPAQLSRAGSTP